LSGVWHSCVGRRLGSWTEMSTTWRFAFVKKKLWKLSWKDVFFPIRRKLIRQKTSKMKKRWIWGLMFSKYLYGKFYNVFFWVFKILLTKFLSIIRVLLHDCEHWTDILRLAQLGKCDIDFLSLAIAFILWVWNFQNLIEFRMLLKNL
jgi:hypothetical protein